MSELLVDGQLVVKVKVEMELEDYVVTEGETSGEMKTAEEIVSVHTRNIFKTMTNTDLSLSCEGEEIPCHRIFLMVASSVFGRMMESGMKEVEEEKIDLRCSLTVGREQVSFIYTGKVKEGVLVDTLNKGDGILSYLSYLNPIIFVSYLQAGG